MDDTEFGRLVQQVDDLQTTCDGLTEENEKHAERIARLIAAMRVHVTRHRAAEEAASTHKSDKRFWQTFIQPVIGGFVGGGGVYLLQHLMTR